MTADPTTEPAAIEPRRQRRYHLRHVTTYDYAAPTSLAHHDLCVKLRDLPYQRVHQAGIQIEPAPDSIVERRDGFGNHRHFVAIQQSHEAFTVVAEATIDVLSRDVPTPMATLAWEEVRNLVNGDGFPEDLEPLECSLASPGIHLVDEITRYARESFRPGRSILEAARDLNHRIFTDFTYEPGATAVSTPVAEAFAARNGVCQDFAQIAIAGIRGLGLAARYVSGYIRTTGANQSSPDDSLVKAASVAGTDGDTAKPAKKKPRPAIKTSLPIDEKALRGADASHAWFSVWCGPAVGWVDLDPTNNLIVDTDHVVIGWGRDYADISPVKGVIIGGGAQELSVAVDLVPADTLD